jgi:succinylarginine dihydrolase
VSKHGCLVLDGSEVALAAVRARGRRFPEMETLDAVEAVRRRLAPEVPLELFVEQNATDPELRAERTAILRRGARRFAR